MPTNLTEFDPEPEVEQAGDEGPANDITLEDLGEDKELNTPPPDDEEESGPDQEEPEAEKPEEPEPKTEAEKEQTQKADQAAQKTEAEKTTEDILKYLGLESPLKIKGKEYKLSDFGKDDLLAYVQKGVRMTQIGQELSDRERLLADRERAAEANAAEATKLFHQLRSAPAQAAPGKVPTEPPEELKPSEYDTEDVRAVKSAATAMWKQNQEQAQRLHTIESGLQNQQTEADTKQFLNELDAHRADFPLASTEEVIAIHSLRPDIPLSDLVRRSHAIYGSVDHVDKVFQNAPEVRKHYEDKFISAYLSKQKQAKVMPQKPTTPGTRTAAPSKPKIRSLDDAGLAARKALDRIAKELEGDND